MQGKKYSAAAQTVSSPRSYGSLLPSKPNNPSFLHPFQVPFVLILFSLGNAGTWSVPAFFENPRKTGLLSLIRKAAPRFPAHPSIILAFHFLPISYGFFYPYFPFTSILPMTPLLCCDLGKTGKRVPATVFRETAADDHAQPFFRHPPLQRNSRRESSPGIESGRIRQDIRARNVQL